MSGTGSDTPLEQLAGAIAGARSVVALTGAGISVPSGIPDFRSPGSGLWENVNPMEVAHIDAFHADPDRFWSFYAERFAALGDKRPNGAHMALAELERRGLLEAVITQNVDRLHTLAGSRTVIEVHGSIAHSLCLDCGARYDLDEVRARAAAGTPCCDACTAAPPLKPDVVLFGELLPQRELLEAHALCGRADLLLAIGSSLLVHPVAALPGLTLRAGGRVALITNGETPYDDDAFVKLDGDVEAEMQALLAAVADRAPTAA